MSSPLSSPPGPCAPTRLPRTATKARTPARRLLRRNRNTSSESSSTTKITCSAADPQLDLDGNQTLPISRRELIGQVLSLGPGLVSIQSAAAAERPCDLTVAPSGIAYCDRIIGTGPQAVKGQLIKAHYVGKLDNGKVFDSSYNRGKPLAFRVGVGEVIKGWDEGILGGDGIPPMLAGGKRTLKLPPELGYGMRGAGCRGGSCIIPPSSVLLFDVDFIGN